MIDRVLLIEDTISPRSALFTILSGVAEVSRARSLIEAIAQCEQLGPNVIVADCPIQGDGAADVIAAMRGAECMKPLILVTHEKSPQAVAGLLESGAFAHVRKPAPEAEVIAAVWRAAGA